MEITNQQPPLGQHSLKSTAAAHRGEVFPAQPPRHARSNPRKMPFQTLVRIDGFVERRTCTRAMEKIWGNMAAIILLTVKIICQWIGLREKLQENRIFHGKINGFRLRFSHHPILWLKGKHYRIYLQKSVSVYSDI